MTTPPDKRVSRRAAIAGAAGALGGAVLVGLPYAAGSQRAMATTPPAPPAPAPASTEYPVDPTKSPGAPTTAVGSRAPSVKVGRTPVGEQTGFSLTPHHALTGTITPSDLHFERHHAGIPRIDPSRHTLTVHGLVERPTVFTVDELQRFPQVTRVHFLECSGNGRSAYRTPKPEMSPQVVAGLTSNSEWTGVPLRYLFDEAGVKPHAKWFLAEGGDACLLARSVPVAKAYDDALIVWAQNGEPLRPENGFPMRLLLPGWEGNINVKWLRRLELGIAPWATRWETSKYTDPLPGGKARQYSFELDAKSIITAPAYPGVLSGPGWQRISGLAWSGRGAITRVEVSPNNGRTWSEAELQGRALAKAHVRFELPWKWDGTESVLLSRATDDTGYTQPTRQQLVAVRGIGTDYHFNHIVGSRVQSDGRVFFHGET